MTQIISPYTFRILRIHRLERARVAVLDGEFIEGRLNTFRTAELVHDGMRYPLEVKGVVLDYPWGQAHRVSLTVALNGEALVHACEGDLLVGL